MFACTKILYLVKSDLLLQIIWIFRVILHPPPPPPKKKTRRKKERIIYHDNVMSYGAGYLSHNFCSIVRARLAILLPNDFVAIDYCKITVDLNLPEFPCIISHRKPTSDAPYSIGCKKMGFAIKYPQRRHKVLSEITVKKHHKCHV